MSTTEELIEFLNAELLYYEGLIVAENKTKTYLTTAQATSDANIAKYTDSKAKIEEIIALISP